MPRKTSRTKTCRECKKVLPRKMFDKHQTTHSGLMPNCRQCSAIIAARVEARRKRAKKDHELKVAVSAAMSHAKYTGQLPLATTKQCQDCGLQAEEYHHESYAEEDWLKVIPLCKKCHVSRHVRLRREYGITNLSQL